MGGHDFKIDGKAVCDGLEWRMVSLSLDAEMAHKLGGEMGCWKDLR